MRNIFKRVEEFASLLRASAVGARRQRAFALRGVAIAAGVHSY
jgi:hypothetical protein